MKTLSLKIKDIDSFKELYANPSIPRVEISKRFNCHPNVVFRLAKKLGLKPLGKNKEKDVDVETIRHLYINEKLSLTQIATRLGCNHQVIHARAVKYGIPRRSRLEQLKVRYEQQRKLRNYRRIDDQGYVRLYKPDHIRANKNGEVREHILVWEETHNKPLPKGWVVHHINGVKADNRPDNLVAYPRQKHFELIPKMAGRIRRLEIENRQLRRALEDSQMIFYIGEN